MNVEFPEAGRNFGHKACFVPELAPRSRHILSPLHFLKSLEIVLQIICITLKAFDRVICLQTYASHFQNPDGSSYTGSYTRPSPGAPHLLGTTEEIENLRPRTPPPGSTGQ